ncbi:MAG TPA: peptidase M61 [Bacteroidetes bacterium]|nr:peptidase M61 [Bacteroidota bacterium]
MVRSILIFLFTTIAVAQSQSVHYEISFENAIHHEAEVTVQWSGISSTMLEARMSRSSPGRYAVHEFAKNVYNVRATDGKKRPLTIERPDPYQWNISGHDGTVILSYTVYGDRTDGTYLGIDRSHAHLNIPATFMWARGFDQRPITIKFNIPKENNWKIATQLKPTSTQTVFTAPNLQYFMDSPVELSNHQLREWITESDGNKYKFKIAMHSNDIASYLDAFTTMTKAVVSEHRALWGGLPPFDNGEYIFIGDYQPYANGDGMEHRNSTAVSSSLSLEKSAVRLLGTVSHEFFHSWNVERIRPKSLEPFNFEQANMSEALWFAEGFTTYYGSLLVKRAKITSIDDYVQEISGIVNFVINSPASKYSSAVEMSQYAPLFDAAASIDVTNTGNTYISYYSIGATIALGLDLTIRSQFPGTSLDDVMRKAKDLHGVTEKPYTLDDLRTILGSTVNDQKFADTFFKRYVNEKEFVDYTSLLAYGGMLLRKANEGKAWLGTLPLRFENNETVISSGTLVGSPIYKAGLDRGDTIKTIDGKKIGSNADVDSVLVKHKPGDAITIECNQRGEDKKLTVTLAENPKLEIVLFEKAGKPITPAIIAFRESWLGKKSTEQFPSLIKYCPECKRSSEFQNKFCPIDGKELKIVP